MENRPVHAQDADRMRQFRRQKDKGGTRQYVFLAVKDDMHLAVELVRILRVGTEEADDLGGIMAVLGKISRKSGAMSGSYLSSDMMRSAYLLF